MATEKRLIDANAIDYENIMCSQDQLHWLYAIIEKQPTVDAVEVVHGRWGEYEVFKGAASLNGYPCSACGKRVSAKTNYCPNCGADMRERKDNG